MNRIVSPKAGAIVAFVAVGVFVAWYFRNDHLPPPRSEQAFGIFIEKLKTEGISKSSYRACKNAFPLGPCSPEMERRLEETSNLKRLGMQDRVFYHYGKAAQEGDTSILITVEGEPRSITGHNVLTAEK